jgi:hypothetical protein
MIEDPDPATVVAVDYELATRHALGALHRTDEREQLVACLYWARAVEALGALSTPARNRALAEVAERGRVPEGAWDVIEAALDEFAAAGDRQGLNG